MEVARITIDVKRLIVIRICLKSILCEERFGSVECMLHFWCPFEDTSTGRERDERRKRVRALRVHVAVNVDRSDEGSKLFVSARTFQRQDWSNLFLPRFETSGGQPIAEPICFLNTPFTLERVDSKVAGLQDGENLFERCKMVLPGVTEDANVVNVGVDFVELTEETLHDFLRDIRGFMYSHGETIVTEVTKRCANVAQIL